MSFLKGKLEFLNLALPTAICHPPTILVAEIRLELMT